MVPSPYGTRKDGDKTVSYQVEVCTLLVTIPIEKERGVWAVGFWKTGCTM